MSLLSYFRSILFILCLTAHINVLASPQNEPVKNIAPPPPSGFEQIKSLRIKGDIDSAQSLAIEHLKIHPNDDDVRLLLGLIYYQKSNYSQAAINLQKVLENSPSYLDAKIGLIRVKLVQKQYKEAATLMKEAIKQDPNNPEVKAIQVFYKKVTQANQKQITKKNKNTPTPRKPSLIDQEIKKGNLFCAETLIDRQRRCHPCDPKLLAAKANIFYLKHQYAQSGHWSKTALALDPANKEAKEVISNIKEVSIHQLHGLNEIGLSSFNQHVSDLRATWDYSTLYYSRDTPIGLAFAKINFAARLGERAPQGELEFMPVITENLYFDLDGTYANKPELFPKYSYFAEGYWTIPKFLTVSGGYNYNYIIRGTYYKKETVSLSKSLKDYWLSLRANHYLPNSGARSTLYIGTIRRYINANDYYLNFTFGMGTSPDLSDLQSLDFLIIKNRFANLGIRFPICNHQTLVDIGIDYQNWKYPSGLVRELYGVNIGFNYKF